MTLQLLDTFSGIGGFSYAAEHIVGGFETVAFVEREPYCQRILGKHWPNVPIYDDITTFNPQPHSADVICGGFPCQDISTAGKQAGIKEGTRSGLFYELMRVIRLVQPRYVVLENVAAILANGLDTVLGELAKAGFDAEWACIPASAVGACHQRDRWWLVAYSQGTRASTDESRVRRLFEGGSIQKPWNSDSQVPLATYANNPRLEGREPASVLQYSPQWSIGTGNSPCARLSPEWTSYVSRPVLCRGDDGLSGRVDRLKALGNAVVPQVAAIPLARVLELERVRAANPATHPPDLQHRSYQAVPQ
jgi:DNA (cytosine-5)-methyltransferase 1